MRIHIIVKRWLIYILSVIVFNAIALAKQRKAIANYQKQLNQEKAGHIKTENSVFTSEFNRLLDNLDNQIKRINKFESQSKPIAKPFGR